MRYYFQIMTKIKKTIFIVSLISLLSIIAHVFVASTDEKPDFDVEYEKALQQNYRIYSPAIPKEVTFAGEKVPLDNFYVKESLEREILINMYWQSNMLLIMKRSARYFPTIEKILKEQNVPEDFKYLCIAESGLMNLTSPAKAQGYWQFIKSTGEKYGLEINTEVDERNSIELSTLAACNFLKDLKGSLGNWTSAAAAYNCGESGLRKQMNLQGIENYYDLAMNTETSRYLYRILAFKTIMENPKKYGYYLRNKDLYYPMPYTQVTIDTTINSIHEFAKQNEVTYKMLKTLNPWMTAHSLPNKSKKKYTIKLPVKKNDVWTTVKNKKSETSELIEKF